jgi:hypothetical protein
MNVDKIIKLLSIDDNIQLIGSNAIPDIKYSTDFDFQEIVKINSIKDYNNILVKFQNIFMEAKKNKNIFITDMKAGSFNSIPVRWDYNDIINGFKFIDTKLILFVNTLNNNDKVKIDLIVYMKGEYVEISCNYYFNGIDNKSNDDIYTSLLLDIKKYYHEQKFMKMLKRIMSYRKVKNQSNEELINFFNTDAGLLYQAHHKIETILILLEKFNDVNMKQIISAVKRIIKTIPKQYINNVIDYNNLKPALKTINENINNIVNKLVIEFI